MLCKCNPSLYTIDKTGEYQNNTNLLECFVTLFISGKNTRGVVELTVNMFDVRANILQANIFRDLRLVLVLNITSERSVGWPKNDAFFTVVNLCLNYLL